VVRLGKTAFRHFGGVSQLAFSRDGKLLATVAEDHTLRVWDAATGRRVREVPATPTTFRAFPAFSADGKLVLVAEAGGGVRAWGGAWGDEEYTARAAGTPLGLVVPALAADGSPRVVSQERKPQEADASGLADLVVTDGNTGKRLWAKEGAEPTQ